MVYAAEKPHFKIVVEKVKTNFMMYGQFHLLREDIANCEFCSREFKNDDITNIAFIKGKKNYLICDCCTLDSIKGGAKKVSW